MSVVISGKREVPIEEVMARGRRAAQGYLDLGLKAGDTIALVLRNDIAFIEASLAAAPAGARYQFERQGYFCVDPDSRPHAPVFNRTVTLKDTWAKIASRK